MVWAGLGSVNLFLLGFLSLVGRGRSVCFMLVWFVRIGMVYSSL